MNILRVKTVTFNAGNDCLLSHWRLLALLDISWLEWDAQAELGCISVATEGKL